MIDFNLFATQRYNDLAVELNQVHTRRIEWPCQIFENPKGWAAFVAYPGSSDRHWPVFDYVDENYSFYASNDGDLEAEEGPVEDDVYVVEGREEFTVQTSSTSWNDKKYDTPVILVRNPGSPDESWIFNWTDPHGQFNFSMPAVDNAQSDYLVFWEDLYNPFDPHSLDDWKDHVVRVTHVPPDSYRIAVYLAKGGYKHGFYLPVAEKNPLEGNNPYNKSGGVTLSDKEGQFYTEQNDQIYAVKK